jgi:hypothetical protein
MYKVGALVTGCTAAPYCHSIVPIQLVLKQYSSYILEQYDTVKIYGGYVNNIKNTSIILSQYFHRGSLPCSQCWMNRRKASLLTNTYKGHGVPQLEHPWRRRKQQSLLSTILAPRVSGRNLVCPCRFTHLYTNLESNGRGRGRDQPRNIEWSAHC